MIKLSSFLSTDFKQQKVGDILSSVYDDKKPEGLDKDEFNVFVFSLLNKAGKVFAKLGQSKINQIFTEFASIDDDKEHMSLFELSTGMRDKFGLDIDKNKNSTLDNFASQYKDGGAKSLDVNS